MGLNSSILLLSLIEDILDLSKIDAGTFSINISNFNLSDLIDEVYDVYHFQCLEKKLRLEVDIEPCLEQFFISSDRGRIKQVLLNLISNSFKFTFEGMIKLSISIIRVRRKEYINFIVEDTGIGIKQEDQDKLFKLFGMIKNEESKENRNLNLNPNGCGIGLNVCK